MTIYQKRELFSNELTKGFPALKVPFLGNRSSDHLLEILNLSTSCSLEIPVLG